MSMESALQQKRNECDSGGEEARAVDHRGIRLAGVIIGFAVVTAPGSIIVVGVAAVVVRAAAYETSREVVAAEAGEAG